MTAIYDESESFQDVDGKPIVNGFIYIGLPNSDTKANLITIFLDRSLTTSIANPQRTDSFGKAVNKIHVASTFSILVTDENDVQKFSDADAGGRISATGTLVLGNVAGINDITAIASPTLTAYEDKQQFSLTIANDNTGPVTLKIDALAIIPVKNEGVDLAAGRLQAGTVYVFIYNSIGPIFQLASTSGGDVSGPSSSTDGNVVLFDQTTGKLIKDSGINVSALGGVSGPGSSVANNVVSFLDTSGNKLKDSGVAVASLGDVDGPAGSTIGNLPSFFDATGKKLQDSNKRAIDVVTGPSMVAEDEVVLFDGTTGRIIKGSGKLISDLIEGPTQSIVGNFPEFIDLIGKNVGDSGVGAKNLFLRELVKLISSPINITIADDGKIFECDTTGGNININLPDSSTLSATDKLRFSIFLGAGNPLTLFLNVAGTDEINAGITQLGINKTFDFVYIVLDQVNGRWKASSFEIAGGVEGPSSAVNNNLAAFDATTGKLIKDSGLALSSLVTASSTTNFTNKTYDANNTGNNLTNIDIGNSIAASQAEAIAGIDNSKLVTVLRVAQEIASVVTALINKTFDAKGTGNNLSNIDIVNCIKASQGEAEAGLEDTKLLTSLRVAQAIAAQAGAGSVTPGSTNTFTNKSIDADGPGNVITNIDIGNCIAASQAEAQAGIENTKLLTSLRVAEAIAAQAGGGGAFRGAFVKYTVDPVLASATAQIIAWDAEEYDTDGIHDNLTNNSRLTVPAGVTRVVLKAQIIMLDYTVTGGRRIQLRKNGSLNFSGRGYVGARGVAGGESIGNGLSFVTPVLNVVPGQYFELDAYQNSGINIALSDANGDSCWFAMEIIE